MLTLDGSFGEGGGQIIRTSLGLSMVTGTPFHVTNVRAGREKPGLMRQHLTAVQAAAAVCGAAVDGAAVGSRELTFRPGKVKPGEYTFNIGSAGSTTLVFQTVLPALLTADAPSVITLEGGTHNPHAPPLDFLEKSFVPVVNRTGATIEIAMERAGFYPAGGGRWVASVAPAPAGTMKRVDIPKRGEIRRRVCRALVAGLPGEIAQRELDLVRRTTGWPEQSFEVRQLPAEWGPGNVVLIEIEGDAVTEVFAGFGMRGVRAEAVADGVLREAKHYLAAGAPVGPHLADQLLIPLALAGGGSFVTQPPTEHTTTNAEVIRKFLDADISLSERSKDQWMVEVGGKGDAA